MAIRLIAADIDDTLLNERGELSPRTKDAVQEVMRRGARFVLASGRMPQAMRGTALALGVNAPVIGYNGGQIADALTGEVVRAWRVPEALAREAAALAQELGGHVQAYQNGAYFYEEENDFSRAYAASIGLPGSAVGMPVARWLRGEADKLLVIGEREPTRLRAERLQAHFGDRLRCAISRPNYIEIFHAQADKAEALAALAEEYGLRREEIAAFGDGENDLGMLHFAGHGYVMANARVEILRRAPAAAPSNAQDGLARLLERWLREDRIAPV